MNKQMLSKCVAKIPSLIMTIPKNFPQGNLPLAHSFNYGNQESLHMIKVPNGTIETFLNKKQH